MYTAVLKDLVYLKQDQSGLLKGAKRFRTVVLSLSSVSAEEG